MILRRTAAALLAPFALAAAAEAQPQEQPRPTTEQAAEIEAAKRYEDRDRRIREEQQVLDSDGMLAAVDVGDGARIGIGRFTVPDLAKPRSWMERPRDPMDMRHPDRGIAAFGMRLPF